MPPLLFPMSHEDEESKEFIIAGGDITDDSQCNKSALGVREIEEIMQR